MFEAPGYGKRFGVCCGIVLFAALGAACALDTIGTGAVDRADEWTAREDAGRARPLDAASGPLGSKGDSGGGRLPEAESGAVAPGACDQDQDGHLSVACGGDDCCDTDPASYPGAPGFQEHPNACGSWDWNCDGRVEPRFGATRCEATCQGEGFAEPVGCGERGWLERCDEKSLFGVSWCAEDWRERTQGCR